MLVYRMEIGWGSSTYAAISAESAAHDALFSLNIACSFSSSVMGLPFVEALIAAGAGICASRLNAVLVLGVDRHLSRNISCGSACTRLGGG
jgi:hypothetical protein